MKQTSFVISVIMLAIAVLFAFYLLTPFLEEGYSVAGDDCVHISYSQALREIVLEHGRPFGWSYLYGTGAPIFIFRPPGFYLAAVGLDMISGGLLDLVTAHKLIYILALALYPLAIYYLLGKFNFPFLVRGIGSLLALGPVSTWGHTLDAYFDLGLAKQALALLLVPFVLGKLNGIIRRREAIFPGALLFGLAFLNHPYMALSLTWLAGLYLVIYGVSFSFRQTLRAFFLVVSVFIVGILLVSFWLIPFYSSPEIHPTTGYLSQSRHGFSVMTDTAAGIVGHFLDGSLFDAPSPEPFGSGSVWAWRDNTRTGRWPALTWACLVGLFFMLAGFRYFKNLYFLSGFIFSLLVFMGPDDLPILRLIPFQEQFQYIHWIPVPELFCVCAAAVGIYSLPAFFSRLTFRWFGLRSGSTQTLFWICLAIFLGVIAFPVMKDRLNWAGLKVRTRDFNTRDGMQTAGSLRAEANRDFQFCLDELSSNPEFSRFYASPTSIRAGQEIFYFTVAPALADRGNVISPLFSGLVGGWNRVIGSTFRKSLWQSRSLVDLLGIHSLITHRDNLDKFSPLPEFWEEVVDTKTWKMYRLREGSSNFGFTDCCKLVAFLDYHQWEEFQRAWGDYYRKRPKNAPACFALLADSGRHPGGKLDFSLFKAIVVTGGPEWEKGEGAEQLARARNEGCRIFSLSPLDGAQRLLGYDSIPWDELVCPPVTWEILEIRETREKHEVDFIVPSPGWVYFKTAYYRGWLPLVDGSPARLACLTPGYNAVWVEAGSHTVSFEYQGANNSVWGWLVSGITFVLGLISLVIFHCRRRKL